VAFLSYCYVPKNVCFTAQIRNFVQSFETVNAVHLVVFVRGNFFKFLKKSMLGFVVQSVPYNTAWS
jgi:hypothetical protein